VTALADQFTALLDEHGPHSACWLAREVGRRKADVLEALHLGAFVQVGKGRAAKWDVVSIPATAAVVVRYEAEIWKARCRGAINAVEALELLLDPKPRVLELLAEVAA
jgi:hypothetical protein